MYIPDYRRSMERAWINNSRKELRQLHYPRQIGYAPDGFASIDKDKVPVPASALPWRIFQWTPPSPADSSPATYWRNVRVHKGLVNGVTTTEPGKVHEQDTRTTKSYNTDYDILCPASATTNIWCHVQYTRNPYCSQSDGGITINSVSIQFNSDPNHNSGWWPGYPAQYPSAGHFYFAIGTVAAGVDTPPGDPTYQSLTITQIALTDQTIYSQPILFVTLTSDGGSAGDKNTACTYTYQATDLCGKVVGASLSPQNSRARILMAPTNVANKGTVYWDNAGILRLWDCNETLTQYSCPNTVGGGSA